MKYLLTLVLLCLSFTAQASVDVNAVTNARLKWPEKRVPPAAFNYLGTVKSEVARQLPEWPFPWTFGSQIEQETCYGPVHSKCWNPKAELKTKREYGFGIGQITIAYRLDGAERFNNFKEAQKLKGLRDWKWEQRYDFSMQLTVMLQTMSMNWRKVNFAADDYERAAMSFNSYNGGYGGLITDRAICAQTKGCNPSKWYGNIELYSKKSKHPEPGYRKSFFEISREYPYNIQVVRGNKYRELWDRLP